MKRAVDDEAFPQAPRSPITKKAPAKTSNGAHIGQIVLIGIGSIVGIGILAILVYLLMQAKPAKPKGPAPELHKDSHVGQYRIVNAISTGQISQVWEAINAGHRHVAVKILLPEYANKPEYRQALFAESSRTQHFSHPYVIKVLESLKDKHYPGMVMEFFPSTNLKLRLLKKDPVLQENMHEIIEKAATALAYVHSKGWVHRDVKPDHFLVNNSAEVRLIDFGLAQRMSESGKGVLGNKKFKLQGTRSYMSPEQIRGEKLDARSDLYSFGISLYEVLTGRPPFRAASPDDLLKKQLVEKPVTPQAHNSEITKEMAELVLATLAKKRAERLQDLEEFLVRFRRVRIFRTAPARKQS